mmetsp:Transcript_50651/g.118083  ORF Transcript_50651/g.118083 Transcript_50651/m.118083 type:complete len:211 (+) Transcript_50651:411-1043(+)
MMISFSNSSSSSPSAESSGWCISSRCHRRTATTMRPTPNREEWRRVTGPWPSSFSSRQRCTSRSLCLVWRRRMLLRRAKQSTRPSARIPKRLKSRTPRFQSWGPVAKSSSVRSTLWKVGKRWDSPASQPKLTHLPKPSTMPASHCLTRQSVKVRKAKGASPHFLMTCFSDLRMATIAAFGMWRLVPVLCPQSRVDCGGRMPSFCQAQTAS